MFYCFRAAFTVNVRSNLVDGSLEGVIEQRALPERAATYSTERTADELMLN